MKLTLVTILTRKDATVEQSSVVVEKDSVTFGRGSGCDVILKGLDYSLNHAKLIHEKSGFFIEDLGSLSGVSVNGQLIKRNHLNSGDTIGIGPIKYEAEISGDQITLTLKSSEETQSQQDPKSQARKYTASESLPSLRVLSWLAIGLIAVTCALYPWASAKKTSWGAGPITNHHKPIEADCTACHQGNFSAVSDSACKKCHELTNHGDRLDLTVANENFGRSDISRSTKAGQIKAVHSQKLSDMKCVTCHEEHNGNHALVQTSSKLCSDCHASIKTDARESKLLDVVSWDKHPEFLSSQPITDPAHIRLNHKVHLKSDIRGPNGPVTLKCADCHQLSEDKRTMRPISRKLHCASCHSLGFEERLPNVEVPHAPPDVVYQFLYAQYAQLLLADNTTTKTPTRMKPGAADSDVANEARKFAHAEVQERARHAEKELFTRTACKLCHEINPATANQRDGGNSGEESARSMYQIVAPEIPSRWMPNAKFTHVSHDNVTCQSCHGKVDESEQTSDVHLPKIADCKKCHADGAKIGKVDSSCVACHDFHNSVSLPVDRKIDISLMTQVSKVEK